MKNILITHDCFVKGEPFEAGVILENVENGIAAQLLTSGRATLDLSKPKKAEKPEKEEKKEKPVKKEAKKVAKKSAKNED